MTGHDHVAILLATRNGARFLRAQLESIAAQTHDNWSLHVSDDGSCDPTLGIVAEFARAHPGRRIVWRRGPGRGSTANFLSLICDAAIRADFVALADQDDVWLPGKLARAIGRLEPHGDGPALYGSRTWIAGPDLEVRGQSPMPRRAPGFRNALVQNFAGGNTMVLNAQARQVLCRAAVLDGVACHDWWLYQIISGVGGRVIFDPVATLLYRQHGANQIGSNAGLGAALRRLAWLAGGRYAQWNQANTQALGRAARMLTPENRACLDAFRALRDRRGIAALRRLHDAGLFRQSRTGDLTLALAVLLGRA